MLRNSSEQRKQLLRHLEINFWKAEELLDKS